MKTFRSFLSALPSFTQGKIARGSIGTLLLKGLNALLGLLLVAAISRVLGADGFGSYAIIMAWVSLLSVVASIGLPQLVVREVSGNLAKKKYSLVKGLINWSTKTSIFTSTILSLVVSFCAAAYWQATSSQQALLLMFGTWLVPLYVLNLLRQSTVRGFGYIVIAQIPEKVLQPALSSIFFLIAVFVFLAPKTPFLALLSVAFSAIIGLIIGTTILIRKSPLHVKESHPVIEAKKWTYSALPMAAISGMQVIIANTDVVMLGWLANESAAGIYRVSARLTELVSFATVAISMPLAPRIAAFYETGKYKQVQETMTKVARWSLITALTVISFYGVAGDYLLSLFGYDFRAGYSVLLLLGFSRLIASSVGPVGLYLIMLKHEASAAKVIFWAATANIILNLLLIPRWHAIGAAFATTASMLIWTIVLTWLLKKRTGFVAGPYCST